MQVNVRQRLAREAARQDQLDLPLGLAGGLAEQRLVVVLRQVRCEQAQAAQVDRASTQRLEHPREAPARARDLDAIGCGGLGEAEVLLHRRPKENVVASPGMYDTVEQLHLPQCGHR